MRGTLSGFPATTKLAAALAAASLSTEVVCAVERALRMPSF